MIYTLFQRKHSQLFTDIKTLPLSELLTDFLHTTQCIFCEKHLEFGTLDFKKSQMFCY